MIQLIQVIKNLTIEQKIIAILSIIVLYLLLKTSTTEKMSSTPDTIRQVVKEVYHADVQAIKNLGDLAKQIKDARGILTIPADVRIEGTLFAGKSVTTNGDITGITITGQNITATDNITGENINGKNITGGDIYVPDGNKIILGTEEGTKKTRHEILTEGNYLKLRNNVNPGERSEIQLGRYGQVNIIGGKNPHIETRLDIQMPIVSTGGDNKVYKFPVNNPPNWVIYTKPKPNMYKFP